VPCQPTKLSHQTKCRRLHRCPRGPGPPRGLEDARQLDANRHREKPKLWGPPSLASAATTTSTTAARGRCAAGRFLAPQIRHRSLYHHRFSDREALLAQLGKHSTGKACLYIKKLADVDQKVLEALVVKSVAAVRARHPS